MRKRILTALLAVVMACGLLGGCANDKKEETTGKKTFVFGDTTFNAENV